MNRASGTKTSFLFLPATFTFFSLTKGRKEGKRRGGSFLEEGMRSIFASFLFFLLSQICPLHA